MTTIWYVTHQFNVHCNIETIYEHCRQKITTIAQSFASQVFLFLPWRRFWRQQLVTNVRKHSLSIHFYNTIRCNWFRLQLIEWNRRRCHGDMVKSLCHLSVGSNKLSCKTRVIWFHVACTYWQLILSRNYFQIYTGISFCYHLMKVQKMIILLADFILSEVKWCDTYF